MIDEELIEKKIDIILENLNYLEDVRETKKEIFLGSFEKIQAIKHSLQEAIEACVDIANHIISAKGFRRAETYSEMFEILRKQKILSEELGGNLTKMAKFRNLIVHRYGDIDNERVYMILQENLKDIKDFVKEIENFLKK